MNKVISADSHVQEPPELYERIPKSLRHRAPHVVERDGARYLVVDGRRPRRLDVAESRTTDDDRNREFTGPDSMLWGSDYPHDEGSFPHSQEVIARTFEGLSDEDREKIVWGNAARIYGFDA